DHATGNVIWAAKGRSKATVNEFFDALGDRAADVAFVTADGYRPSRVIVRVRGRVPLRHADDARDALRLPRSGGIRVGRPGGGSTATVGRRGRGGVLPSR